MGGCDNRLVFVIESGRKRQFKGVLPEEGGLWLAGVLCQPKRKVCGSCDKVRGVQLEEQRSGCGGGG